MARRLEVTIKSNIKDVVGEGVLARVKNELKIALSSVKFVEAYNIDSDLSDEELDKLGKEVFADVVIQDCNYNQTVFSDKWRIEIGYLPGVTDNVGNTAREAIYDALGKNVDVYYSRIFAIEGKEIGEHDCQKISLLLHNQLVEKAMIRVPDDVVTPYIPKVAITHDPHIEKILLPVAEAKLKLLAKERLLALNIDEFKAIKAYLKEPQIIEERKRVGLDHRLTDVELEAIAQTWSEHCKHKIFNSQINYVENGEPHAINSLFSTFIRGATEVVKKPYIVSVFKDNGGIIKFNHDYDISVKVETHNAPSALDPYGGALTGVLGVQRDILGTGIGSLPIANIDALCFGYPDETHVPKGVIHPKRIYQGVTKGVEHGGNKMGIPTVNGSITFERGFTARPLVYCGTIGIMPSKIGDKKTCEKHIKPGYLAVMVGGRIGKDGIHGATFSSQQIDQSVPQSVVQIGDPITQKKVLDFVIEARDLQLYEAITDNGAGGISSSIGELAQFSNGCEIYLEKCPLKYIGLDPWEILVSESQERMTLAVPVEKWAELQKIAKKHATEVTIVGKFTNSGKFHVMFRDITAAYLDLKFLHEGLPQLKLSAEWKRKVFPEPALIETDLGTILEKLLASPNIASKEEVIRRYDHEVKGMSVIKPLMRGPNDAGVIKPVSTSNEGLVIAHGICPKYIQDSYDMSCMAFDEAVRNAIAVGGKFGYMACLDNFSWPDPIKSDKNPDGEYKLAQLIRSCIAIYEMATDYGVPIISGKDSMKNDYYVDDMKYSIPPTLLITIVGKIDDVKKAITADLKQAGDHIYVLGKTRDELGGSDYYKLFNGVGDKNPKVRREECIPLYKALTKAIEDGLVSSCHDVSDGGIAITLAECTFGTGLGADLDISLIPRESEKEDALLFSESAGRFVVSVTEKNVAAFEKTMQGTNFAKAGRVRGDKRYIIRSGERLVINKEVETLRNEWLSLGKRVA